MRCPAVFLIFVFFYSTALASDAPFVPSYRKAQPVRFETPAQVPPTYGIEYNFDNLQADMFVNIVSTRGVYAFSHRRDDNTLSVRNSIVKVSPNSRHDIPRLYVRSAARYYSISADPGFTSALGGGITAGLTVGYDRYIDSGVIDAASAMRAAAFMTGSSYAGTLAVSGISGLFPQPTAYAGTVFAGALSDAAGASAAGVLFAAGAYAAGSIDIHSARRMAAKSMVGSSLAAGITALLGTGGVTTGIFAVGTFALPYATAIGAAYAVERLFEGMDREEEKERISGVLSNTKVIR